MRTVAGRAAKALGASFALLALTLTGCGEVESENGDDYHPAIIESVDPTTAPKVRLTEDAAKRIDLSLTTVRLEEGNLVVDYDALVYDQEGATWLYAVTGPLTFVRTNVMVYEIDDDEVVLSKGPPPETQVVARGVTQVYGAELGMEGGH